MKTMKMLALALVLIGATTAANAATTFLATDDFVGISFWLISMGMLACLLYTSPSPRDPKTSRMPSSA